MTVQGHKGVLNGVFSCFATAQHHHTQAKKRSVVFPKERIEDLGVCWFPR
jgi:hypothetical protein